MKFYRLIEKKRDGFELSREEISSIIQLYTRGEIPDYQMSAFAMAVYFKGMTAAETFALTESMMKSGKVLSWAFPTYDKHSTGGVGDKISIILAPILSALGLRIPMIAGRGLGHTGGTVDKLESIAGYKVEYTLEEFQKQIEEIRLAIIGQSDELAPADKKLYALRDVTGTVPSIPLITASILSKKMAEGIDALLMDIKFGRAAFMQDLSSAKMLAKSIIDTGNLFKRSVTAFISNMDEPLGNMVGNRLEIIECVNFLEKKSGAFDLYYLTYMMAAVILLEAGKVESISDGLEKAHAAVCSGKALDEFYAMLKYQGVSNFDAENYINGHRTEYCYEFIAKKDSYIKSIDALRIGHLAVDIGAGRRKLSEQIDPEVGIEFTKKAGDSCKEGEILAFVYYNDESLYWQIDKEMTSAYSFSKEPVKTITLIEEIILADEILSGESLSHFEKQIMDMAKN